MAARQLRQYAKAAHAEHAFELIWRAEGVVAEFAAKRQKQAERDAGDARKSQCDRGLGRCLALRRRRLCQDAGVRDRKRLLLQRRFVAIEEALVEILVGLRIALQFAQPHTRLGDFLRAARIGCKRLRQVVFLALGHLHVASVDLLDPAEFVQDQAVDILHLPADFRGRLMLGAVAARNVGFLLRDSRILPAQIADHRVGQRIDDRGVRVSGGDHAGDLLIARALLRRVLLRLDQARRQVGQLRIGKQLAAAGIRVDDAVLALVILNKLIGGHGLLAEFGKSSLKPDRCPAHRFEARIELFFEIGGSDRIGHIGGKLRILGNEADGDDKGLIDPIDVKTFAELDDRVARNAGFSGDGSLPETQQRLDQTQAVRRISDDQVLRPRKLFKMLHAQFFDHRSGDFFRSDDLQLAVHIDIIETLRHAAGGTVAFDDLGVLNVEIDKRRGAEHRLGGCQIEARRRPAWRRPRRRSKPPGGAGWQGCLQR